MRPFLNSIRQASGQWRRFPEVWLFFGLALCLRAIHIYRNSWLAGDSYDYLRLAKNLAFYGVFGYGENGSALSPSAFRPPLYPTLVAAFWWQEQPPTMAVLYFQALLGAITVALVYYLALRNFGRMTAILAALGMTIAPFTINYTAVLMTETLFTFLITFAVCFWEHKKYIPTGFLFGLAALTRPNLTPMLAIIAVLPFFSLWKSYRKSFLLIFLAATLTILPWTIRNALYFREFVAVSSFGYGMSFLCGTIDVPMLSDEGWGIVFADPAIRHMSQNLVRGKNETEIDRQLFREGLQRVYSDPARWLKVRAKQYTRLFIDSAPYLLGRNNMRFEDALRERNWFFILFKLITVSSGFLSFALDFAGIWLVRARLRELIHIAMFPVYLAAIHLPFWTENRYLLPAMPFVCILAAFCLTKFFHKLRAAFLSKKLSVQQS